MRVYAAVGPGDQRYMQSVDFPNVLVSFAFDRDGTWFDTCPHVQHRLGDSGAFSAWTRGEVVALDQLIEWCRKQIASHPSFQVIALDVIPGTPGGNGAPSPAERERAMAESLANGDAMRAAGLRIMEVFHVFEPMSHLDLLLDRRQPGEVIGLGGLVGRSRDVRRAFCDSVFAHVRDRYRGWRGIPPMHGLGVAPRSQPGALAIRYPWWSIDSTTWLNPRKYGQTIGRSGTMKKGTGREGNRHEHALQCGRILDVWKRREIELSSMWTERGVTFDA